MNGNTPPQSIIIVIRGDIIKKSWFSCNLGIIRPIFRYILPIYIYIYEEDFHVDRWMGISLHGVKSSHKLISALIRGLWGQFFDVSSQSIYLMKKSYKSIHKWEYPIVFFSLSILLFHIMLLNDSFYFSVIAFLQFPFSDPFKIWSLFMISIFY